MRKKLPFLSGLFLIMTMALPTTAARPDAVSPLKSMEKVGEKTVMLSLPSQKKVHISSDDVKDPVSREKVRRAHRHTVSGSSPVAVKDLSKPTIKKEAAPLYTVTCVFEGEDMPYFAVYNPEIFLESSNEVWFDKEDNGEPTDVYTFQVPAGTYDFFADFYDYDIHEFAYIIHEDVEVKGDITVTFSQSEATETFWLRPVMQNGKEATLPVSNQLDHEPWQEFDDSNATAQYLGCDFILFKEGCENVASGMISAGFVYPGKSTGLKRKISKVSDKYHLVAYYFIEDKEGTYTVSTTDVTGISSKPVDSYHEGFIKYPYPEFAETPLYKSEGVEKNHTATTGVYWVNNVAMGGVGLYSPELSSDAYVTTQPSTAVDLKTVISVANVQMEKTVIIEEEEDGEIFSWKQTLRGKIESLPAWYNGMNWEYINQNHSQCGSWSYQAPEEGPVYEYPGLAPYCYSADGITQPLGNSSPLLVIMTKIRNYDGVKLISFEPQAWIGRYGEVRNCDMFTASTIVTDEKGNVLYDNSKDGYFDDWKYDYFFEDHEPGKLIATFTDNNVLVDGEITGFNKTVMEFDEANDDNCTPTPQMLIFKNTEGVITDRFEKAADGVMEFSAGDFNWVDTDNARYFTVDKADIEVAYSPYGEDSWQALEVEEIPEYFYMPGFGYFYRGSLKDVSAASTNGWYDLKMTLTDKAGNKTTEVISPAFRIGTVSGVAAIAVDGVKVWKEGNVIRTSGTEVKEIKVFSADGRMIAGNVGESVTVQDVKGICVIRVTTADGNVSNHKVIF